MDYWLQNSYTVPVTCVIDKYTAGGILMFPNSYMFDMNVMAVSSRR